MRFLIVKNLIYYTIVQVKNQLSVFAYSLFTFNIFLSLLLLITYNLPNAPWQIAHRTVYCMQFIDIALILPDEYFEKEGFSYV